MFGDIAHGLALFCFGIWLFNLHNSNTSESISLKKTALGGFVKLRWMFTLMGFFAMYCGACYNDFAGFMLPTHKSCYTKSNGGKDFVRIHDNCTYPFGFDWVWSQSNNEIEFFNSFKMKFSIVIAVIHMSVSIIFKGLNCIYYGNVLDLLFEFVPQLVLFLSIFGYMVFCIVIKWAQSWDDNPPPEIINLFTNIVIDVDKPLWNDPVQQLYIQRVLV